MNGSAPFAGPAKESIRLGILGCGNMGGAFARGVRSHEALNAAFSLIVYDPNEKAMQSMREMGAEAAASAVDLARQAEIIMLAVKPQYVPAVLADMLPALSQSARENDGTAKALVSIAAGVPLQKLREGVDAFCPVVRVMPNILVEVGQGLFALCFDPGGAAIGEAHKVAIRGLLAGLGHVVEMEEDKINAFTALAGSGPGYVYYFMDSLTEAGVSIGLTREQASALSLGLIKGSGLLAEASGGHPAILREQVSSPAGTTIAGLNHLDRTAVRGHVIDAVIAAYERALEMDRDSDS